MINCIQSNDSTSISITTMIHNCALHTLTLLADGRVCWLNDSGETIQPEIEGSDTVSKLLVCSRGGTRAVVIDDGRICVDLFQRRELDDVTAIACETLKKGIDEIVQVYLDGFTIIARTRDRLCVIVIQTSIPVRDSGRLIRSDPNVKHCITGFSPSLYTFTSPINMVSVGYGRGLIRTDDGYLYMFNSNIPRERTVPSPENANKDLVSVNIDCTASIHKIICDKQRILLHMDDGTVSIRTLSYSLPSGRQYYTGPDEPFRRIDFPDDVIIARIVISDSTTFYITTGGLCYFIDSTVQNPELSLLKALDGYHVENVYSLRYYVAIITQDRKVYLLPMMMLWDARFEGETMWRGTMGLGAPHIDGTMRPFDLPFLDDRVIVSAVQASKRVYFTTGDGRAYHSTLDECRPDLILRPIPFFDANPIAIKDTASMIRSARNTAKLNT